MIRYDGSNAEEIRTALAGLKPTSTIEAVPVDGGHRFDQVWHDGQRSEDRWRIQVGQHFDPVTGAVHD